MHPFLDIERVFVDREFIPRLYARVDHTGEREVFFDCVGADAFDRITRGGPLSEEDMRRLLLRIVRTSDLPWWIALALRPNEATELLHDVARFLPFLENLTSGDYWFELLLTEATTPFPAWYHHHLFDNEPRYVFIDSIKPLAGRTSRALSRGFSLDDLRDAPESHVEDLLSGAGKITSAAVYDVGQGSCAAACNDRPRLYFDFGGGVLQNQRTFPATLRHWCFSADPPIVLSHWDWDHWSSATRDQRALNQTWIVPRQQIGPTHRTFLMSIRGRVVVWPQGIAALESGNIRLERCTGTSRNDSGLALILRHDGERMLFPADARYTTIPSASGSFVHVAASHHGAKVARRGIPPPSQPDGRLAYSFGAGNTYGHPTVEAKRHHHQAGWRHQGLASPPSVDRYTADRSPCGLGHIGLSWTGMTPGSLPCGGTRCDLVIQQV